jgi:peptidoglycan-associated lipoprotein
MKKGTLMRTKIYALGLACILLICCGEKFMSPSGSDIKPNPNVDPPTIVYFTANPSTIKLGEKSTLSWEVTDATEVEIDQGVGNVSGTSSIEVSPLETTTYTLEARNSHWEEQAKNSGFSLMSGATEECTITVEK